MPDAVRIPNPGVPVYEGEVGAPLVLVVHDAFGRLPGVLEFAAALAHVGFRVAVPDLYDGLATIDPELASDLAKRTRASASIALLDDIARHERALGSPRVAAVGFARGGELALLHAQSGETDAVVAYDATLAPEQLGILPCPVLLHVSDPDDWRPGAAPAEFAARLSDHGTPVATHAYSARRGFANATIRADWDPNAAALAFARTARFLQERLSD